MGMLQSYAWPGNVRELSNLVDRFNALFSGQLLNLAMVPPSFLPKGLRELQAERSQGDIATTLELSPYASNEQHRFDVPHELDLVGAVQEPPDDVEDIIMLAQGLPSLPPEGLSLKDRLADIERDLIVQALNRTDGNVSQTARLLNLQRTTLIEKLNKYDLRQGVLNVSAA
jgi:sigma-54 specific flagellar transcriptional regulator A